MSFKTAEGANYEGRDPSGNELFSVSMPSDDHGYFGRECPSCHQIFRMNGEDYKALPEDLVLTCTYCGHEDEHSEFMTSQQRDRAMQVAKDAALQLVSSVLDKSLRSTARSSRSSRFVKVSYRSKPFYPQPLPGIDEEKLVRERNCTTCGVRYAVFGDHRFCPVSGRLHAAEIARDALAAETAKLDALSSIPDDQRATLREQGVFDRIAVDTLGRVVGIVEVLASAEFASCTPDATAIVKGRGNIFQRLDDLALLFAEHAGIDPRQSSAIDWATLQQLWAARHAHVHADGRVDEKYLRAVPSSTLKVGQQIVITEREARLALEQAGALCEALSVR